MIDNGSKLVIHLTAKKTLIGILSLQLALLGLIELDKLGLGTPILRQVIGFVCLTFVPGFLILKVLRVSTESSTEVLLYSVGLSLTFLMFTGALTSCSYPLIGISKPISEMPLLTTISIVVFALSFIWYLRNRKYSEYYSIDQPFSPSTLCFSFLPFLGVFGSYLLDFRDNNALILVLLGVISVIPILVVLEVVSSGKHPFIVWIISISLLLHNSLIGQYAFWGDSEFEYLAGNLSLRSGFWDATVPTLTNSLLSITVLLPIYSLLCNIELTWVFKVIGPFLFSLTPVALYIAFKTGTDDKIAFLSSSLFMFSFIFFTVLSRNIRTAISLLLLSLLILLMNDKEHRDAMKMILLVIFLSSIALVYYGVSYMLLLFLFPATLLHFLDKKAQKNRIITPTFTSLFVAFSIAWYMYTSKSYGFDTLVRFSQRFMNQLTEFLTARSSPSYYLAEKWSISLEVVKWTYVTVLFFTAAGIFNSIYRIIRREKMGFSKDFSFLSVVSFFSLYATLFPLPGNIQRILQILLVFLAPFSVIGCMTILRKLNHSLQKIAPFFFSVLLLILLVFDSGLVSAILIHDLNPNELVNKKHVIEEGSVQERHYFYFLYPFCYDYYCSIWFLNKANSDIRTYAPYWGLFYHYTLSKPDEIKEFLEGKSRWDTLKLSSLGNNNMVDEPSYIFLGYYSNEIGLIVDDSRIIFNTTEIHPILNNSSKIYANGGSTIYFAGDD